MTNPAREPTAINVPAVSKKSTNKNEKITGIISAVKIDGNASNNAPNVGFKDGIGAIICVGKSTTPKKIPTTAVTIIPIKIAAGVLRTNKIKVTIKPITVIKTLGSVKLPIPTSVASLFTIIPEFWNPKNAIKNPIPVPTACFNDVGILLMINSRNPVADKIINKIPETKIPANACCQLYPIIKTTV